MITLSSFLYFLQIYASSHPVLHRAINLFHPLIFSIVIFVPFHCYICTFPLLYLYLPIVIFVPFHCYICTFPLLYLYIFIVIFVPFYCYICTFLCLCINISH